MTWFKYIWVGILALGYIIWTVKCVVDFIDDVRGRYNLSYLFIEGETWWGAWIAIHIAVLFLGSLVYFLWQL